MSTVDDTCAADSESLIMIARSASASFTNNDVINYIRSVVNSVCLSAANTVMTTRAGICTFNALDSGSRAEISIFMESSIYHCQPGINYMSYFSYS